MNLFLSHKSQKVKKHEETEKKHPIFPQQQVLSQGSYIYQSTLLFLLLLVLCCCSRLELSQAMLCHNRPEKTCLVKNHVQERKAGYFNYASYRHKKYYHCIKIRYKCIRKRIFLHAASWSHSLTLILVHFHSCWAFSGFLREKNPPYT